jgi:hypothetical protein
MACRIIKDRVIMAEKYYPRVSTEIEAKASSENIGKKVMQNALQLLPETGCFGSQGTVLVQTEMSVENTSKSVQCNGLQSSAGNCRKSLAHKEIHLTRFELVTFGSVDRCSIQLS